jgi:transcriptional regulator with PAS, ATPase and Fis domain
MTALHSVRELIATGRYGAAQRALDSRSPGDRLVTDLLKLEILERVGQHNEARALAHQFLKRRGLPPDAKSTCEFVLGRLEWDAGNTDNAVLHFQRAVTSANHANDRLLLCWRQLWLWQVLSEKADPDAAAPHLADVRANIIRVGHPQLTAAGHIFVGKMEAKRGLVDRAELHTSLGQRLLREAPNCWLNALAEITHVALAIVRSDFEVGLSHALLGLQLAEESGVATVIRACLGNLGNVFYLNGEFDLAGEYFERAIDILPTGENAHAGYDTLAKIRMLQGRLDECTQLLDKIESSLRAPGDRSLYVYRHTLLTRAALLSKQHRWDDALQQVDLVLALAERAGDKLLTTSAELAKAGLLQRRGKSTDCLSLLAGLIGRHDIAPLDMYAQSERVLAAGLTAEHRVEDSARHLARARRIYKSLHSAPGLIESESFPNELYPDQILASDGSWDPAKASNYAANVLHSVSTLLAYTQNLEVTARELVQIIAVCECAEYVCALSHETDGAKRMLVQIGSLHSQQTLERRFQIGRYRGRLIELIITPKNDFEAAATVNSIGLLLASTQELQQARAERQERAPLWPADDPNVTGDGAVVSGRMRELMTFAQRVARANVTVLITGESGTGKEILARAIHTFSDRAQKPFVPVNCAAVPRELLESHLFGHRRGAFTGADRDQAGFIRAARDGTLFLDEVAELGLDLQPKLLRFLESGEIAPLGEPGPLTVNVRILAATNRHLEDLVQDGKFREDLFYRLNVVRLSIPPLRERRDEIPGMVRHFVQRAAEEFRKGHLTVAEETMERLLLYRWPGNVRQLHNELRRMVALAEPNSTLLPDMISDAILGTMPLFRSAAVRELAVSLTDKLPLALRKIESEMIQIALREHRGKVEAAAKALGISRKGLYLKRQRLGL